jgi:lipoprotein-anchoring transpeptidase ErfK/SrfK
MAASAADAIPVDDGALSEKIASIAMRTWVYQEPNEDATKLGYLRAGAIVARARTSAGTRDCAGGWYRIAPRGYVCVGKGASLDLGHAVLKAAVKGPRRGEPVPYPYVVSGEPPPHLYFKLPSEEEQRYSEGKDRDRSVALHAARVRAKLGPADPIPQLLSEGADLPKPYGAEAPLAFRAHRGRAREASAFGLIASYDWTGRPIGLTTELDLIPLDRTRVANVSEMRGVVVERPGTPAFVISVDAPTYDWIDTPGGSVARKNGTAPYRSGWVLTGKNNGSPQGLLETTRGVWLAAGTLRIAELREDPAGFAEQGRKWIDVSIRKQMLVAYEGKRPVFATLISSGRGEMGDPEKTTATVRGTFMIASKHVSGTMDGDEKTREAFDLRDVPYIQYFYKGYALHGAYWHDDFGKMRSHGCVNLSPADAAWLFEWTEPAVPEGWHGAQNPKHGTLVYTHG